MDEKALEKAMKKILNPDFGGTKGEGGRDLVRRKYTWKIISEKLIELHKEYIES